MPSTRSLLPLIAGLIALAACSQKTQDAADATANSASNDVSADFNGTAAATRNAADAAKPSLDQAGSAIGNAADATDNALGAAGNSVSNAMK